jgi:hypothetical protein
MPPLERTAVTNVTACGSRSSVILTGLCICALGLIGCYFTSQRYWFKTLVLNVVNFIVFIAIVVIAIISIIFAFDIRDPVGEGIVAAWPGPDGLHAKLEAEGFCTPDITASLVASEGIEAISELDDCKLYYQWVKDSALRIDGDRCLALGLTPNMTCPNTLCARSASDMANDCKLTYAPQTAEDALSACDTSPDRLAKKMCMNCDHDCMKLAIQEAQDSVAVLPFVCYFVVFFICLSLMFNIYMMDIAEDIDMFHSFMEMEAATRGVTHFNEERPEFEGTMEQKIGLFVNLGVTFLGFVIFLAGCIAWGISTEHFIPVAKTLVFDGFCLMALAMTIETGIKKNNMDMVSYANAALFFFAFLTMVLGITTRLASGGMGDLHEKIESDHQMILEEVEYDDPTFCGLSDARLSNARCQEKMKTYLVDNVTWVAYLSSCIVALLAVIMYLTHEEMRQFYTGHLGDKQVNGQLDRMVKARIVQHSDHVRRLSPEERKHIEQVRI